MTTECGVTLCLEIETTAAPDVLWDVDEVYGRVCLTSVEESHGIQMASVVVLPVHSIISFCMKHG
jgi:hypothetical protein